MKKYVFGYGSLINLESAAKTLQRPIGDDEIRLVSGAGYFRVWRIVVPVRTERESAGVVSAVFLDIKQCGDSDINGVLIETNEEELGNLDIRESSYDRIEITSHVRPRVEDGVVYTYQGKAKFFVEHYDRPVIPGRYLAMVAAGVKHWGTEFSNQYDATTEPCPFEIFDGAYQFCDDIQNFLTGHDK